MTRVLDELSDRHLLWVFLAAAVATRSIGHLNSGLWVDEIWTLVDYGRLPLGELLTTYGSDNNHPLFTVLAWLSMHVFGESAWALRLPAVIFGVASVGATWWLARAVTSRGEALLTTVLLLLSYHHVWYSQNARGYTILLFCTVVSTLGFARALEAEHGSGPGPPLVQGIFLGLGSYAHISAVFVGLGQLIAYAFWLVSGRRSPSGASLRPLHGLFVAAAVSLILYLPILDEVFAFFLPDASAAPKIVSDWNSPWWMIETVAESAGLGLVPGLLGLAGGLLVLSVGAFSYLRRTPALGLVFVLPGLLGGVAMLVLGRHLWPRFFFFQASFILLIVVRGVFVLAEWVASLGVLRARLAPVERTARGLRIAAAGLLLAASCAILPRAYLLPKQDFEGAMEYIRRVRSPGEPVLATGLTVQPYERYFDTDFVAVRSMAEVDAALATGRDCWVTTTLPTFLESRQPEVAAFLLEHASEAARFPGSVGGGDVVVSRLPAAAGASRLKR